MAVSVIFPVDHVEDSNGLPYVGARKLVYDAGTTTLRDCYTDAALTNPASNPQISDAAGNFTRVFTAPGTYKVRLEQAVVPPATSGELISEADDIDSGLSAGSVALPIANGGTGATTAAAARANLGVPSTSELTAISTQIAAVTASLQSAIAFPQGRLTLTSATPVLSAGVTAATAVYYTPYTGQLCPVYDGAQFNAKIFTELTLTLNASHVLNSIYDVYFINDASAGIQIVTSAAWSNIVAGSCSRSGTADLARVNGILVNAAQQTMRNGATTYVVAASQGTYLGSIYIDGTAGQVSCLMSYGQSRKWGVWNAYNRVPLILKAGDPTASWSYTTSTIRASNNSSSNYIDIFSGLSEEIADLSHFQMIIFNASVGTSPLPAVGVGYNSTTVASGRLGYTAPGGASQGGSDAIARYIAPPGLGLNRITALEKGGTGGTTTFNGTEASQLLSASWRG